MPKHNLDAIAARAGADLRPIQKGRGLAGLLSNSGAALENARRIPLDQIELNPAQARQEFDEQALADLTDSVRTQGVLQPIGVLVVEGGYRIIWGEQRYRASVAARQETIPAIVFEHLTERETAILTAVENALRTPLSASDEARQYLRLTDLLSVPATELAGILHVDHNRISRLLRIARERPDLLAALDAGTLTFRAAVEAVSKQEAGISHGEKSERTPRADMPDVQATPSAVAFKKLHSFQHQVRRLAPDTIPPEDRPDFRRTIEMVIDDLHALYHALDEADSQDLGAMRDTIAAALDNGES